MKTRMDMKNFHGRLDTTRISPPTLKEAFVGTDKGKIVRIPAVGSPADFHIFPSGPLVAGLAWHAPSDTLFSAVTSAIYRHNMADGTPVLFADKDENGAPLVFVGGLAFSHQGKLHAAVSGNGNDRILKFDSQGRATLVHDTGVSDQIFGLAFGPSGELFYTLLMRRALRRVTGKATFETWADSGVLDFPWHIAIDRMGQVLVASEGNDRIVLVSGPRITHVLWEGPSAGVDNPSAIAVDAHGNVWVGNTAPAAQNVVLFSYPASSPIVRASGFQAYSIALRY
jgi:DNA-binding beta-propeller fold protein YncE